MSDDAPSGYSLVAPSLALIPEVVELLSLCAAHDKDSPATEADVRRQWSQTIMQDVTLVRAKESGALVGVVGAVPMPSIQRLYLLFNVHPQHRANDLPAFLLSRVEDYAKELQANSKGYFHIDLVHPISGVNIWKRDILPQMGFTVVRGMWKLRHDIAINPDRPVFPEGITISRFDPAQHLGLLQQVVAECFVDHHNLAEQRQWLASVTRDGDYDPDLWFLAWAGDELIAFVLSYPDPDAGVIALVGVREPWRGQRIALNLLKQAFVGFFERGIRRVLMHVDSEYPRAQALRVYQLAGMQEVDALLIYEKRLLAPAAPLE